MTNTHTDPATPELAAAATVVAGYLAAWNADDPTERRRHIEATWTPDHRFVDPLAELTGHDALDGFIGQVRSTYPGSRFVLLSVVDAHHDVARWSWEMLLADGSSRIVGHDAVRLAADGRIAEFTGFFGPLEPAA